MGDSWLPKVGENSWCRVVFCGLLPSAYSIGEGVAMFPCIQSGPWYVCRLEMTTRPSSHSLLRVRLVAIAAASGLVACPSCTGEAMSTAGGSRATFARGEARTIVAPSASPSQIMPAKGRYPDPRYRPAMNFPELQAVAGQVAKTSGRKIRWHLELGKNPGPLVRIRSGLNDCTIAIHPVAARKVPPNTWAFIFG